MIPGLFSPGATLALHTRGSMAAGCAGRGLFGGADDELETFVLYNGMEYAVAWGADEDDESFPWGSQATSWETCPSDGDGASGDSFLHVYSTSSSRQTSIGFQIPQTLSASYDIYIRTLPLSVVYPDSAVLPAQYRFYIYERDTLGNWPTSATVQFRNPEDGARNYVLSGDSAATTYIGTYDCDFCYYCWGAGLVLNMQGYVLTSQRQTYTKELCLDWILFVPSDSNEDTDPEVEVDGFTGIRSEREPSAHATPVAYYTLSGQRMGSPVRGAVNLVRMSDGTVRKALVR